MKFNYSKLRGRMRECGYTQAQLAGEIGMYYATLSAKLNNKSEFTSGEIEKICQALEIEREDIGIYFFVM